MTTGVLTENATIELYYDDSYQQQVIEENHPGGWINIGIMIGGTYLWNMEYEVTGFATGIILQLLESVSVPLTEERYIIELEYGPSWIAVEPRDEHSVTVAKCVTISGARNPEKRLDIDTALPVTKRGWIEAVTETAQHFRETVLGLNPDLHDHTGLEQIHYGTTWTETLVETEFDADR